MSNAKAPLHPFLAAAKPLAPLLVLAAALGFTRAGDGERDRLQCTATLDPDTVGIQTEPTVVGYALPDSVGTVTAITPAEDSGIVAGRIDAEAQTVELRTAAASSGDWPLTFMGEGSRTCIGTLTVVGVERR
jgi:hypothetical protein